MQLPTSKELRKESREGEKHKLYNCLNHEAQKGNTSMIFVFSFKETIDELEELGFTVKRYGPFNGIENEEYKISW